MNRSIQQAESINERIKNGISIDEIKSRYNADQWYKYSACAYEINLVAEVKERSDYVHKKHTAATSNTTIQDIYAVNEKLVAHALLIPTISTRADYNRISKLCDDVRGNESQIMAYIEEMIMTPRMRVLQKKGRFERLDHFKIFYKLIDAATLCYYRNNFLSCYLTLLPIIEGVILRWIDPGEREVKPDFMKVRNFFKNSFVRQPAPWNIQFHNIFTKGCDQILNEHFYLPTSSGQSYANFNRHVAAHLLNNNEFGTRENCIRLFILLDMMTDIFVYESRQKDPRFYLLDEDLEAELNLFSDALIGTSGNIPEIRLLSGPAIGRRNSYPDES